MPEIHHYPDVYFLIVYSFLRLLFGVFSSLKRNYRRCEFLPQIVYKSADSREKYIQINRMLA